ncbi:MAG: SDR family oxidoreductase, partial [Desulfobacterales bacterium]
MAIQSDPPHSTQIAGGGIHEKPEWKIAVVTGVASGIGRALAYALATEGCRLAISDINADGLSETTEHVKAKPTEVHSQEVDVSRKDQDNAFADEVRAKFGTVDLVINNAGVAVGRSVENMTYEDYEWIFGINFWGMVYGTKAFLPTLLKQNEGHIANVSSVFGLIGVPSQSGYNATKFAIRGFTEALRHELI